MTLAVGHAFAPNYALAQAAETSKAKESQPETAKDSDIVFLSPEESSQRAGGHYTADIKIKDRLANRITYPLSSLKSPIIIWLIPFY